MKHTQGTWKYNLNKTMLMSLNDKNEYVTIYNASPYQSVEPNSRDAALITAAPELLKALEYALEDFKSLENRGVSIAGCSTKAIENLIKKAKGE